jgi:hypothetical protein
MGRAKIMMKLMLVVVLSVLTMPALAQQKSDVEATTSSGDKVLLHPNGRWEFFDTQKQSEAKKVSDQFPENQGCPPGSQGGWFGTRCIPPGDKDYNRGTLNPSKR